MFQRMIDDFKHNAGTTVRMSTLAILAGLALFVTLMFLCAAGFIAVLQSSGPIAACLTLAGVFIVIAVIFGAIYAVKKKQARRRAIASARAAAAAKTSAASSLLADPMLLATGLQLVRALGIKKLIPLLAVGGIALGLLAGRAGAGSTDDDAADDGKES